MKTTVDIADLLLIAAKKRAAETRTTLRAILEAGLRHELAEPRERSRRLNSGRRKRIRWVTAPGGLPPGLDLGDRVRMHDWLRRER